MTLEEPRVAVVVPAYNRAEVIGRALESILSQKYLPTEIVVVDDGSSDGTADAVAQFGSMVRCVRKTNGGVSSARNFGIEQSQSEWIAFLDSDDCWYPDKLVRQAVILQKYPFLKWCSCNGVLVSPQSQRLHTIAGQNALELRDSGYFSSYFRAAGRGAWFHTNGMLIHRTVFNEVGLFDTSLSRSEDLDLWWRIAMKYPAIGYVPQPMFEVREGTANSLVRTADRSKLTCLRALCMNMGRAQVAAPQVRRLFRRFGLPQVMTYALKTAAGEAEIPAAALDEGLRTFQASFLETQVARLLHRLPRKAARVIRRLQEDVWQPIFRRILCSL